MNIIRPGHPLRQRLDKIQTQIATLTSEIDAVVSAPLGVDEFRQNVRAAIRMKADRQRTEQAFKFLRRRLETGRPPALPTMDFWAAEIFLHGEQFIEDRLVEKLSCLEPAPGLPKIQRAQRITELQSKITELERAEELETLRLEGTPGNVLIRRPTADPVLLIGIWADYNHSSNGA